MSTTTFQVRIPTEDLRWLRDYAKANDLSVAQAIRRFIREARANV